MNRETDELLDELLERWEESREQGRDVSAQELCRDLPHVADELARRIDALKEVSSWLDPDEPFTSLSNDSEPNAHSCYVGRILGDHFRLDERIAEGGFAEVWRGYDQNLEREVAVKVPKPSRIGSARAFIDEARRVAKLNHRGIVPIYDLGYEGQLCFLVFPLMRRGLVDLIRTQQISPADAIRLAAEVAEALNYAHDMGYVHRDIKPENILLDEDGCALLTDFGISVRCDEADGSALGTIRYMSPEQVEGKPAGRYSDLYSLGVVLHEMLTGRLPYPSDDPSVLRQVIVNGELTLEAVSNIPPALKFICRRLLERIPEARYASALQLAADLRREIPINVKLRKRTGNDPRALSQFDLDSTEFKSHHSFCHPAAYSGPVWVLVVAQTKNLKVSHRYSIRWGPWTYNGVLDFGDTEIATLVHMKGDDGLSIPTIFDISPPCYVGFGQGDPPSAPTHDINFGWRRAKGS